MRRVYSVSIVPILLGTIDTKPCGKRHLQLCSKLWGKGHLQLGSKLWGKGHPLSQMLEGNDVSGFCIQMVFVADNLLQNWDTPRSGIAAARCLLEMDHDSLRRRLKKTRRLQHSLPVYILPTLWKNRKKVGISARYRVDYHKIKQCLLLRYNFTGASSPGVEKYRERHAKVPRKLPLNNARRLLRSHSGGMWATLKNLKEIPDRQKSNVHNSGFPAS